MLNNNIKILLVSFVHHIELQNFLNAPRNLNTKKPLPDMTNRIIHSVICKVESLQQK